MSTDLNISTVETGSRPIEYREEKEKEQGQLLIYIRLSIISLVYILYILTIH